MEINDNKMLCNPKACQGAKSDFYDQVARPELDYDLYCLSMHSENILKTCYEENSDKEETIRDTVFHEKVNNTG